MKLTNKLTLIAGIAVAFSLLATGVTKAETLKVYTAIEADDLKKYAAEFNKVEPDIEWEILCDGECIGIGCIKPSI